MYASHTGQPVGEAVYFKALEKQMVIGGKTLDYLYDPILEQVNKNTSELVRLYAPYDVVFISSGKLGPTVLTTADQIHTLCSAVAGPRTPSHVLLPHSIVPRNHSHNPS